MTPTLLLFDIDGTLMRTRGAGMRAMQRAGDRLFGDTVCWENVQTAGSLDPHIFAEAAAQSGLAVQDDDHERFRQQYLTELEQDLGQNAHLVETMPGIHDILKTLRRRSRRTGDVILGMLTGNYSRAVPLKLATIGVDTSWFPITAFGDEAPTRPDLVALALKRYEELMRHAAVPRSVVVIGDTPRDVECAHAHGCVAFAVATGDFTIDQLSATGAEHVVADLSDPAPLLAILDGA